MFRSILASMAKRLDEASIPYMVIGGQAVLLHGEPRLTRDIDVTLGLPPEDLPRVLALLPGMDLTPLVDPEAFVRETMVLPCRHPSGVRVDFVFSFTPFERQAIERAVPVALSGQVVRFASAEDLVIHKVFAGRPRDLEDARTVLLKQPDLDLEYIRTWLAEFDRALAEDFSGRLEALLRDLPKAFAPA